MKEIWKDVPFNDDYEVSDQGRVRKKSDQSLCKFYHGVNEPYDYIHLPKKVNQGSWYSSKRSMQNAYYGSVHKIVASVFCDNPDPEHLKYVDHINGKFKDNRACNLQWVSMSYNIRKGNSRGKVKVRHVESGKIYSSMMEASKDTGVRYETIRSMITYHTSSINYPNHFEEVT